VESQTALEPVDEPPVPRWAPPWRSKQRSDPGLEYDQLETVARLPDETLRLLDKLDCEESLMDFVELGWHITDPSTPMVRGWVMEAICEHLEAITAGHLNRVLINVPPGTSKTQITNVFWPAWEWGPRNLPHLRYCAAAYAERLMLEANRKCRNVVKSPWYQALWGDRVQVSSDIDSKVRFGNTAMGWKLAMSVGGATIGERGDRFVVDDPHNTMEAESDVMRDAAVLWFFEAASSRQNNPARPVEVVIMQRLHEYDVSGAILEHAEYFGFEHLCIEMEFEESHPVARKRRSRLGWRDPRRDLPKDQREGALCWPERYTAEAVRLLKEKFRFKGGEYAEAGQLRQFPIARKGGMFDVTPFQEDNELYPHYVVEWHDIPEKERLAIASTYKVRGWDLAGSVKKTSPFTAGVLMAETEYALWVVDCVIERLPPEGVDALIEATADRDDADPRWAHLRGVHQDLPQDPGQAGKAQVSHLATKALAGHVFEFSPETGEKEIRALPFASQVNARRVRLVKGPWNRQYVNIMKMFPAGRFKDPIDASSRAYAKLLSAPPLPPPPTGGQCIELVETSEGVWGYEP